MSARRDISAAPAERSLSSLIRGLVSILHRPGARPVLPDAPSPAELRREALAILRSALDDPRAEFRPHQWEAIERLLLRGERLLVVQRTGWGKSVVYFVATRLLRNRGAGPTLLISPLLSLMRNQVAMARRLGLSASTINSSNYPE